MHFSAGTFLAPYLHQISAVMKIMHYFGAIWDKYVSIKFYADLASKIQKFM